MARESLKHRRMLQLTFGKIWNVSCAKRLTHMRQSL
jgi:hypothetical protein